MPVTLHGACQSLKIKALTAFRTSLSDGTMCPCATDALNLRHALSPRTQTQRTTCKREGGRRERASEREKDGPATARPAPLHVCACISALKYVYKHARARVSGEKPFHGALSCSPRTYQLAVPEREGDGGREGRGEGWGEGRGRGEGGGGGGGGGHRGRVS
jgi:hypothetical protein